MSSADLCVERRWRLDGLTALIGAVALAVTWVAASASTIPAWEEDVFRFFNDWPDWLEIPMWPVMQFGAVAAVPVLAVVVYLVWRKWQPSAGLILGGMAAWLLAKVVKDIVERGRPEDYLSDVNLRPAWEGLGFVSGHAATAFAIAVVLTPYLTRPWRIAVWTLAVATGLLRMYTAAHLPLDIIGGAGLGLVTGATAHLLIGTPVRLLRRA
jgi:undecaprenyl-diphosphatase